MNQFEAQLVDFGRYAYSINPLFGAKVEEAITQNYSPAPSGLGAWTSVSASDASGVNWGAGDPSPNTNVLTSLANVVNSVTGTILNTADSIYQAKAKLNQLQTTDRLQTAQNDQLVSAAHNGLTPGVLILILGGIGFAAYMVAR